ncbi:hypothetical protein TNCV_1257691 [Trichonephila clavipes]|nr:hypothetical protein TNCV_1257691 [Trichonephila clavipes]
MFRGRQLDLFDEVSEFDQRRIVAYRDCGLSFKKIGQRSWVKPSNSDADFSSLDAGRNDGAARTHLVSPLPMMTSGLCAWQ